MSDKELLPCPFCGGVPEISKHFKEEMYQLIHRCKVMGPLCIEWTDEQKDLIQRWNTRNA